MSKWQRLSGYLHTKPTGTLKRFKVSQRQWYTFDEMAMLVRVFRNEEEANLPNKEPLRVINITNAYFYVDMPELNQFIIASEGKEHVLQAETEEAMLLWIETLQARRNEVIQNNPSVLLMENTPGTTTEQRKGVKTQLPKLPNPLTRMASNVSFDVSEIQFSPVVSSKTWRTPSGANLSSQLSHPDTPVSPRQSSSSDAFGSFQFASRKTSSASSPSWHDWITDRRMALSTEPMLDRAHKDTQEKPEEESITDALTESIQMFNSGVKTPSTATNVLMHKGLAEKSESIENIPLSNLNEVSEKQNLSPNESPTISGKKKESKSITTTHGRGSDSSGVSSGIYTKIEAYSDSRELRDDDIFPENKRESSAWKLIRELQNQLEISQEREKCLRQSLTRQEMTIADLDHRLSAYEEAVERPSELSIPAGASCTTLRSMLRGMEIKQRSLQNKINFLVGEVRDLANIRQMLTEHGAKQVKYTKKLSFEVLKWKQDYVKLLEACMGAFRLDMNHGLVFSDYGRKKCKDRLSELLEEARKKDPTLPLLNKPKTEEYHVDAYGFKQSYSNETAVMHYVCHHLHEYFAKQLSSEEQLISQWEEIMKNPERELSRADLKYLCRAGIPANFRGGVWRMLVHGELRQTIVQKGPHYYNRLISEISESTIATKYRKQIALDLLRTMPNNINFDSIDAPGIQKLQEILQAYSIHNPEIGYCQGMNFLVAVALIFLNKEDAFWCLTAILEKYLPDKYFNCGLISAQVDQLVLKDLIVNKLPNLAEHIQKMDIDISAITLNWFLALFYDSLPFQTLVRIWDIFLLEGSKSLFRFALALLKRNEEMLLLQADTISFWKCLKSATRLTYDADSLIKTAYEELHPFFTRANLASLQAHHFEILNNEMRRNQRLWNMLVNEFEEDATTDASVQLRRGKKEKSCVQAAVSTENGTVWICYGGKFNSEIARVHVSESQVTTHQIEVDGRGSCITPLSSEILLVGMISGKIAAYSVVTNELLWEIPIHGGVVDLVVADWPMEKTNRVFAGLITGELVVIENAGSVDPEDSIFTFTVGYTRVSSLLLVDNELWCSCGNSVFVFNTSTLDYLGQFNISDNAMDLILTMKLGIHGVWIAVRGSPLIELRDVKNYARILLFNTSNETCVDHREDEEDTFNVQRVTALMADENTVWVGTGNGEVIVYEIKNADKLEETPEISAKSELLGPRRLTPSNLEGVAKADAHASDIVDKADDELKKVIGNVMKRQERINVCNSPIRGYLTTAPSFDESPKFGPMSNVRRVNTAPELWLMPDSSGNKDLNVSFNESDGELSVQIDCGQSGSPDGVVFDASFTSDQDVASSSCRTVNAPDSGFVDMDTKFVDLLDQSIPTNVDNATPNGQSALKEHQHGNESECVSPNCLPVQRGYCPIQRESRLIEKPLEKHLQLQLQPVLRNIVSESPIRLFVIDKSNSGESFIISCATYFHDDDAILRWKRCQKDELIWTNEPVLLVDRISQQVQLPSYMLSNMRLQKKSRSAIITS